MKKVVFYLNGDGMINIHPGKDSTQLTDYWRFEVTEDTFVHYLRDNRLRIDRGSILDEEGNYFYGLVLEERIC